LQVMMQSASTAQGNAQVKNETATENKSFALVLESASTNNAETTNGLEEAVETLSSEVLEMLGSQEPANHEEIDLLLEGLPEDLKEALETMLEQQPVLTENMLKQPTPEMKLVFLLQSFVADQNHELSDTMKKDVSQLIEKWFPALSEKLRMNDSVSKSIQQVFEQIKKQLQTQDPADKTSFHKVMESLSATKKVQSYAEQAFQRYVPVKQGEANVSQARELQTFQSPLSTLEQWTLKIPSSQDEGQKQQFVREIQQIISRGKLIVTEAGFTKMQIKLTPEHLGTIEVHLIQRHGEITAKIIASSQAAKEAIDGQLSQLKQAFAGQNVEFEKVEVLLQKEEQGFKFTEDQGRQNEDGENPTNSKDNEDESDSINLSFEEQLSQMILNERV
jgi:flagellar hook-length control protein FliK